MVKPIKDLLVILFIIMLFSGLIAGAILALTEILSKLLITNYEANFIGAIVCLVVFIVGSVGLVILGVKPTKEGQ